MDGESEEIFVMAAEMVLKNFAQGNVHYFLCSWISGACFTFEYFI